MMKYRRNPVLLFGVVMLSALGYTMLSTEVYAQHRGWTKEQKDVWKIVEAYSDAARQRNLEAYLGFFHPDFVGWFDGMDTTTDKATREQMLAWYFANTTPVSMDVLPIAVQVYGDCAVAHYQIQQVLRMKDGIEEQEISYWTDVLVKKDGRWLLFSDHGGNGPEEQKE